MSSVPPPSPNGGPLPGPAPDVRYPRSRRGDPVPSPGAYWRGRQELRADLRACIVLVLALAAAGVLAGLIWWWLAPRADFHVTDSGPVAIGNPSEELFVADDSVYVLVLAGFGLVAGAITWFLRRRRGVAIMLALALGCTAMSVVAWQLGELLGAGPSEAELSDVGAVVTTALRLASHPALAVAPFLALFVYLGGAIYVSYDDLGRTEPAAAVGPPAGSTAPVPPGEMPATVS